ncbi:hypothetical protein ABBQ38_013079 [Trebouxia sp. C0009 RCD-2024]
MLLVRSGVECLLQVQTYSKKQAAMHVKAPCCHHLLTSPVNTVLMQLCKDIHSKQKASQHLVQCGHGMQLDAYKQRTEYELTDVWFTQPDRRLQLKLTCT